MTVMCQGSLPDDSKASTLRRCCGMQLSGGLVEVCMQLPLPQACTVNAAQPVDAPRQLQRPSQCSCNVCWLVHHRLLPVSCLPRPAFSRSPVATCQLLSLLPPRQPPVAAVDSRQRRGPSSRLKQSVTSCTYRPWLNDLAKVPGPSRAVGGGSRRQDTHSRCRRLREECPGREVLDGLAGCCQVLQRSAGHVHD